MHIFTHSGMDLQNRGRAILRAGLAAFGESATGAASIGGAVALDHFYATNLFWLGIIGAALVGSRVFSNVNRILDLRDDRLVIRPYDERVGRGRERRLERGFYRNPQWEKLTPTLLK